MTRRLATAWLAAGFVVTAQNAWCQQWSAELQVGRIRSSLDPTADVSNSVVAGIRYDDRNTQFRVLAGVPTSSKQPYWGALAGAQRLALKRSALVAGIDLTAHGYLAHDRVERTQQVPGLFGPSIVPAPDRSGYAIAGQALPLVGFESQRLQLHVRAGASHYESEFGQQRRQRDAWLGDVQLTLIPMRALAIVPSVKRVITEDTAHTFAGVTGLAGGGRVTVWGSIGKWLESGEGALAWSAGTNWRLRERVAAIASVRGDSFDPLYLTAAQTSWNLGLQYRVGSTIGQPAPIPARYTHGRATIRLPIGQAKGQPRIAGDFNGWKPEPMQLSDGAWTFTVAIAPGVYNFAFVDERGDWFVPEKYAGRKEDGMGGHVAVLVVQP